MIYKIIGKLLKSLPAGSDFSVAKAKISVEYASISAHLNALSLILDKAESEVLTGGQESFKLDKTSFPFVFIPSILIEEDKY